MRQLQYTGRDSGILTGSGWRNQTEMWAGQARPDRRPLPLSGDDVANERNVVASCSCLPGKRRFPSTALDPARPTSTGCVGRRST